MSKFYKKFEDLHRGTHELIRSRLEFYAPFVNLYIEADADANVLDLGCGRGEWLELMVEYGFTVRGIDLDEEMLSVCREKGLPVVCDDAVSFLSQQADASCSIITGFHVAEHIPFEMLQELVGEAKRVLKPAGLLILETPNPENVMIGTTNFYLDPTHEKPIPPGLMAFLPEYYGFERFKIVRLQESKDLEGRDKITLLNVLTAASPDYALLAQKAGRKGDPVSKRMGELFENEYGLSLDALANRFDAYVDGTMHSLEVRSRQNDNTVQKLQAATDWIGARQGDSEQQLVVIHREMERMLNKVDELEIAVRDAHVETHRLQHELLAVYQSHSWRITAPLREMRRVSGRAAHEIRVIPIRCKILARFFLVRAMRQVIARPWLSVRFDALLCHTPRLRKRLSDILRKSHEPEGMKEFTAASGDEADMTASARRVYQLFSQAKKQQKKKEDTDAYSD